MAEKKTKVEETEKVETPKEEKVEEKKEVTTEKAEGEIGKVGEKKVFQKSPFIKFKKITSPVSLQVLPDEIRKYLIKKGFGTNVYERPKEWLEKHHADMEMIAKLKKFISDNF